MMGKEQVESILAKLALDLFSETDLKILRLTQLPIVSQEDVDSALVENALTNPSSASFTIAYNFATIHPEISFPEEVKPLLAKVGIRCRDRHMKLLSHFSKINSALNERGVSFIVIKGGAMKSYRPEWTRWMSDVDILIPGDDFREALDAVRGLGYIIGETHHSAGLRDPKTGQNVLDIHRFIPMGTGKEKLFNDILAKRAITLPFSSLSVKVPSPEDMVFISLVNFWKNVTYKTSERSVANLCFDLKFLKEREGGLNWDTIRSNALTTESVETVYLASRLLECIVPGFFPNGFLEEETDLKKAETLLAQTLHTRNVLCPLQEEIGEFNIIKALKEGKPFFKYVFLRAKYFFLKRFPGRAQKNSPSDPI